VERKDDLIRKTSLYEKLISDSHSSQIQQQEVLSEDTILLIDPMIGMENVSPYDFLN